MENISETSLTPTKHSSLVSLQEDVRECQQCRVKFLEGVGPNHAKYHRTKPGPPPKKNNCWN